MCVNYVTFIDQVNLVTFVTFPNPKVTRSLERLHKGFTPPFQKSLKNKGFFPIFPAKFTKVTEFTTL